MTTTELVKQALERRPRAVLAQVCEVSPMMLSRWANGTSDPSEEQLARLRSVVEEQGAEKLADPVPPPADDEGVIPAPSAPPPAEAPKGGVDPETGEPVRAAITCEAQIKACSVSEKTVALGVEVARSELDLMAADHSLVASRIAVRISAGDPKQGALFEGDESAVEAFADVSKISVGPSTIGFRLSFLRQSVDLDAVARYAGKTAQVEFRRTGPAGEEGSGEAAEGVFAESAAAGDVS